ncbi:phosphonopyruvate decarboxylase [Nocardia terpenica]|uniref:phosphonopyruvate decarboxylase n=1 Tax=Nocardia terpenica TaxID=455432 RepID=UPI00189347BC|nr:phosphonopyruvate decarboxylase [Nocardia terpenica]MBF6061451.1 phosphonopyruvate decarboxylase [Nocardia terpenica]MBF6105320.1 phosphonopyruvate decarboxylase [Nocardia terpenica]MBF6113210.1 phosphonopyruvate decarboxylase [Nocardia terpenica]MBF6119340.1 phosphonopyruvate decarboxylase [Nocardia terpenica]MBF6152988.1 phosphonopyruvate decarboxylase [Nocardia terpenica]
MITSAAFVDALDAMGIRLISGVPCSTFTGTIRLLAEHPRIRYAAAANEGGALAVAAGARLTGTPAAVLLQNSGFGNLINPLTSLVLPYRIPVLVVMSMRGWPEATAGEPQHVWMGRVPPIWLESLRVPHWLLTPQRSDLEPITDAAAAALRDGRTGFLLVAPGTLGGGTGDRSGSGERPTARADFAANGRGVGREQLVAALVRAAGDANLVSTTGYLSRALYNLGDRPRNFYMQGSMGHAAGLALGAALARPEQRFVVLDGDGAACMHLGMLPTIGHFAPPNLCHIVYDNAVYESTGAQPVPATRTDLAAVAAASGYRAVFRISAAGELDSTLRDALAAEGPVLVHVTGGVAGSPGPRASTGLTVAEVAERFAANLGGSVGNGAGR